MNSKRIIAALAKDKKRGNWPKKPKIPVELYYFLW